MGVKISLPEATKILIGDTSNLNLQDNSFDIIYQFTVFTSILDEKFQAKLANKMWSLTKPGGGILWYDFMYDNLRNPDVRGVSIERIQELFPCGTIKIWRVTLAPPISRVVTKIHLKLYTVFNTTFFLRTHALCWIRRKNINKNISRWENE
jgi:ubiquinone/menaquinone biosynthesis C-methylase UbiE